MSNYWMIGNATILDGDILWMVTIHTDVVLKIDWGSKQIVGSFQIPESKNIDYAHTVMKKVDEKIYIFPLYGDGCFCFDITSEKFNKIGLDCGGDKLSCVVRIAEMADDKNIIFVDHNTNRIYKLDSRNNSVSRVGENLEEELKRKGVDVSFPIFSWQHFIMSNILYIPVNNKNMCVCFDMSTYDYFIKEFESDIQLKFIAGDDEKTIFTTSDNRIFVHKCLSDEVEELTDTIRDGGADLYPFCIKDKIVFLPFCQRRVYLFDNGTMSRFDVPYSFIKRDVFPETKGCSQYEAVIVDGGKLYFQARSNGELFCLDTDEKTVSITRFSISHKLLVKVLRNFLNGKEKVILSEEAEAGIREFVEAI